MTPSTTPDSTSPARRAASAGLPPLGRVPLLVLGFVSLVVGTTAGLARLGWPMPEVSASMVHLHGPLMICGFFGVVISLERAVAIGRSWAYLAPLLAGVGGVTAILGATVPAAALFLAASLVLVAASIDILRRQPAPFTFTITVGAVCWSVGNALWLLGWTPSEVVPWWLAFLIVTIAGERLELSRFMPRSPWAGRLFALALAIVGGGLIGARSAWGVTLFAAGLLALAAWLLTHDVALRTVRSSGLTRFVAVCLLSGYGWLALGSATMLAAGGLTPGSASYDAALHALALGFVFSMVFGHAPIIFPAVLRVAMPYHPSFYGPLLLLHASVALRVAGDATGQFEWLRNASLLNALALLAFIVSTASAVFRGRKAAPSSAPGHTGRSES